MRNYEKGYYKEFLDYKAYEYLLYGSGINNLNYFNPECISQIFNTDNDDFIWIFIWSRWIDKATCFTWEYNNSANVWVKNDTKISFKEFNLNPYRNYSGNGISRCIPVVDISDFITILSEGKKNTDFENLLKIDYRKYLKEIKTFDYYIDQKFDKLKDAAYGTFFEIINTIGYSPELFYSKSSFANTSNAAIIDISYDTISRDKFNVMKNLYDEIIKPYDEKWTEEKIKERQLQISDLAGKINKIVFSFVSMYADIYNTYQQIVVKEPLTPPQIDVNTFKINREDVGSLPLEETLRIARPPVQPAFKKSYIVRENNLKAFAIIKMEYQVGTAANDFITLNYFDIPYNSILSIEHSVKDFNMTVNLIDTQGNLSELFIQKMYAISQKKSNALVEKNMVNALGEYRFFIEYGWSGPSTDNDDELLEEQIYVKTIHRGYIKSISSQYTFKGTEYTLNIIPNDLSQFNSGFNDTNSLYYKTPVDSNNNPNGLNIPIGLLVLSLILEAPIDGLNLKISPIGDTNKKNFLFKLFEKIENISVTQFQGSPREDGTRNPNYNRLTFPNNDIVNNAKKTSVNKIVNYLYGIVNNGGLLKDISFTNKQYEELLTLCDKEMIGLNAWVAGMYVIWKTIKNLAAGEKFILLDLTGMFLSPATPFLDMDNFYLWQKINIFNPYCLRKVKIASDSDFYTYITTDNDFNKYYVSTILNLKPDENPSFNAEQKYHLTFVIKQLSLIFSSIKNIGMNVTNDQSKYNVYEGSDGISLIYDIFKKSDIENKDTLNKILEDYKRKIYSQKQSIYSLTDDTDEINKRHEKAYESFKEGIDILKSANTIECFYLSYVTNPNKVAFLNCSLSKKISLLSRQIVQSYSFTPRMSPTRNANKQFFGQGNSQLLKEGSGDIIEFSIDPIDVGNFNSIMLANKNKNNVAFNNVSSHTFVGGLYKNAADYYRTYRNIDGTENITKLTQDMARLDLNYQSQTAIKGSITIPGEPYWSNVNLLMAKCIYIHVYYSSGMRSSHSGLYYVSGVIQNISEGKFTTKLEIIRAPTFLSPLEKIVNKNKFVS